MELRVLAVLSSSVVLKVVILLFLGAEASDALLFELFSELLGVFLVDFAPFLHVTDYLFSLFFRIASPDEVYHVGQIVVETL